MMVLCSLKGDMHCGGMLQRWMSALWKCTTHALGVKAVCCKGGKHSVLRRGRPWAPGQSPRTWTRSTRP